LSGLIMGVIGVAGINPFCLDICAVLW